MSGTEISVLFEKSKELDQLRKELEDDIVEINKLHKKLQSCKCPLGYLSYAFVDSVFSDAIFIEV